MYAIDWYVGVLVSIPESYLIIILGFALYNLEIDYRKAIAVAITSATIAFWVRTLPLTFGIHTLIGLAVIILLIRLFTHLPFQLFSVSIITGFVVMALLQCIIVPVALMTTGVNAQDFSQSAWLNVVFFVPEALIMTILYLVVKRYRLHIIDLKAGEKSEPEL